jgi:hypothetical protein
MCPSESRNVETMQPRMRCRRHSMRSFYNSDAPCTHFTCSMQVILAVRISPIKPFHCNKTARDTSSSTKLQHIITSRNTSTSPPFFLASPNHSSISCGLAKDNYNMMNSESMMNLPFGIPCLAHNGRGQLRAKQWPQWPSELIKVLHRIVR